MPHPDVSGAGALGEFITAILFFERKVHMLRMFIFVSILLIWQIPSAAQGPILRSALYAPVLVSGCGGSASGFFWAHNKSIFFISAAHVLFKTDTILICDTITLESHSVPSKGGGGSDDIFVLDLRAALRTGRLKRHPIQDVAVIELNTVIETQTIYYSSFVIVKTKSDSGIVPIGTFMPFKDVTLSNDVYLLGYPRSIGAGNIPQLDYSQPLLRKGAVAGKNLKNNTIIIDCPSYPGNSGGPDLPPFDVPMIS